jgi:hypothetical protein
MDNPINTCLHLHRVWTNTGSYHFSGGEVWDDVIEVEVCLDCGMTIDTTFDLSLLQEEAGNEDPGF